MKADIHKTFHTTHTPLSCRCPWQPGKSDDRGIETYQKTGSHSSSDRLEVTYRRGHTLPGFCFIPPREKCNKTPAPERKQLKFRKKKPSAKRKESDCLTLWLLFRARPLRSLHLGFTFVGHNRRKPLWREVKSHPANGKAVWGRSKAILAKKNDSQPLNKTGRHAGRLLDNMRYICCRMFVPHWNGGSGSGK